MSDDQAPACPKCGFTYGWDGTHCTHCKYGQLLCDCGRLLDVAERDWGKQVRCPSCKRVLSAPAAIPTAVPLVTHSEREAEQRSRSEAAGREAWVICIVCLVVAAIAYLGFGGTPLGKFVAAACLLGGLAAGRKATRSG